MIGPRMDEAFAPARELHAGQRRKGTDIPCLGHLMAVAALVIADGGDEDEAIAALLHDAAGDQGGAPTLARIRGRFGDRVSVIAAARSATDVTPKPPWRERRAAYLELRAPGPMAQGLRRVVDAIFGATHRIPTDG
jgi:(p)ppGpp synthase/HD superfamily hydrolase